MFWLLIRGASAAVSPQAGALEIELDGRSVPVPALSTDVDGRVDGDVATIHVVQTFTNPTDRPLNARYVFPLPDDAAVYEMKLITAASTTVATIAKREDAARAYAAAKAEGRKAALLDQERPNVFTQQVANLGPGERVTVDLSYAEVVPLHDGAYTLTVPLLVGPRYVSDRATSPGPEKLPEGEWTVQATDHLEPAPHHLDPSRVAVRVRVAPGVTVEPPTSLTHPVVATEDDDAYDVRLTGRTLDNRDFVLSWRPAGATATVGVASWAQAGHGVVSLLVQPPPQAAADALTPRELVFVLDTSCSMRGEPLANEARFLRSALQHLRPGDAFRLVQFSSAASEYGREPVAATPAAIDQALHWVDGLHAGGGSEVGRGLERALAPPIPEGSLRLVVLLTDGFLGNELDVIRQIDQTRGEARIFSLGVGTSVNRYLIDEVARAGHGVARVVLDDGGTKQAADELAARIDSPYLTDVSIDWGGAPVRDASPALLPDVFLGEPLRVLAKFDRAGTWPVTVRGQVAGQPASVTLQVTLPEDAPAAVALPVTWARAQVADKMIDWASPALDQAGRDRLRQQVTGLGLEYHLVTQWTSFVAVAPDAPADRPAVDAVVSTPAPAFAGSATPEPPVWLAGGVVLALAGLARRRAET